MWIGRGGTLQMAYRLHLNYLRTALIRPLFLIGAVLILAGLGGGLTPAADEKLELTVVDRETGKPIPCRMHLRIGSENGRIRRIRGVPSGDDHFVFPGRISLKLPLGNYFFEIERGPEYVDCSGFFTLNRYSDDAKTIELPRGVNMAAAGWYSGDLDVRRPVRDMKLLMRAEDLHVAQVTTWFDGKDEWSGEDPPDQPVMSSDDDRYCQVMAGSQSHPGGTLLYLNMSRPAATVKKPGEYPSLLEYTDLAREHDEVWIDVTRPYWWDLPMLIAHGRVDSIQLAHGQMCRRKVIDNESGGKDRDRERFPGIEGNPRWSQEIYFHLLNCGLRIPPTAGSGSGQVSNPVGYNRVYVHVDGALDYRKWWENLRAGQVVVTNGPLLQPSVDGQLPGHVFQADEGQTVELQPALSLSLHKPVRYLEVIKNGRVAQSVPLDDYKEKRGRLPKMEFTESGWFLIRVVSSEQTTYRFGMTGPYYVQVGYEKRISRRSAKFFLDWVHERARQIKLNDPKERAEVIDAHRAARDFWQDLLDRANAK